MYYEYIFDYDRTETGLYHTQKYQATIATAPDSVECAGCRSVIEQRKVDPKHRLYRFLVDRENFYQGEIMCRECIDLNDTIDWNNAEGIILESVWDPKQPCEGCLEHMRMLQEQNAAYYSGLGVK